MSIPQAGGGPITSKADLVDFLAKGAKPKSEWRIGTEHEKFGYDLRNLRPLPYDGRPGIRAMLEGLQRFGWEGVFRPQAGEGRRQFGAGRSTRAFRRAAQEHS
jgi:glutamate--cysteine ligase